MSHSAPPSAGLISPLCCIFSGFSSSQQSASPPRVFAPPEICSLLFALVPFNVSPSPSPPRPPRAPRGPSSVCGSLIRADAFTCSRISPRRAPTSQAQTESSRADRAGKVQQSLILYIYLRALQNSQQNSQQNKPRS